MVLKSVFAAALCTGLLMSGSAALADRSLKARAFAAILRDVGVLDVAIAANEFRRFCKLHQPRPITGFALSR